MPTSLATRAEPTVPIPEPFRRGGGRARTSTFAITVARLLTVLVGIATAAITLGPPSLVVAGMSGTQSWLDVHPRIDDLVMHLGGVEPAGNLLLFVPFASLLALSVGLRFLPIAFLLLLCSPFAVEWAQQYLPGRVPDGADIVRNAAGLLVAFFAVAVMRLLAAGLRRR